MEEFSGYPWIGSLILSLTLIAAKKGCRVPKIGRDEDSILGPPYAQTGLNLKIWYPQN